jgi:hypothetical protein
MHFNTKSTLKNNYNHINYQTRLTFDPLEFWLASFFFIEIIYFGFRMLNIILNFKYF